MKRLLVLFAFQLILLSLYSQNINMNASSAILPAEEKKGIPDKGDKNNNFYDNEETFALTPLEIEVSGEIVNPGKVDFSMLQKRSVIVKETLLKDDGTNSFIGAYRYDGYSLFDILNDRILKKKNGEEFRPIIDVYVEIENKKGEKVVLTWGEIYYPNNLHNLIIATDVMRIVPSKTKDLWPIPKESRLVVATDLITERNLSQPVKITVRSYPKSFVVNRDMNTMFSPDFKVFTEPQKTTSYSSIPARFQTETLHTIFYGKGRGIHSTQPFSGIYIKELLKSSFAFDRKNLKTGLFAFVGIDGYRTVYSFSEIMNRNDQAEILLVPSEDEKDGGKFRIFPSCDFFSDRAVKALSEIHFMKIE